MKRKIWWACFAAVWLLPSVMLASLARADLTADIHINTTEGVTSDTYLSTDDGDINYNSYVDAEGDYNFNAYWTNGTGNFQITEHYDEKNEYRSGVTLKSLSNWFTDTAQILAFGETRYGSKHIKDEMLDIMNSLSLLFVTKSELKATNDNTLALHYRLEAVEKTLEKLHADKYCESKLEVMRDYNLPGVTCGDWSYSISGNDMIIGVRQVPQPEPEPEPVPLEPEPTKAVTEEWQQVVLDYWDELCSQGHEKWCMIAEINRDSWGMN